MKPIEFKGMNGTAAKHQPEYMPLPMFRDREGVLSCWEMTFRERLTVLFTGKVWLHLLVWDNPIAPSWLGVDSPLIVTGPEMDA